MGRARRNPVIQIKPAEEVSVEITGNLPATTTPADRSDLQKSFEEEDSFLDAKKAEGIRKLKIQNDILEAELTKINNDNEARVGFSKKIYWIVIIWLSAVIFLLILSGFKIVDLSDKVLITLLTTSSVNVIGLLVIIANYLFNKNKST